jgi:hypothetical protein
MTTATADLPPVAPTSQPLVISIPSNRPVPAEAPGKIAVVLLQVSHRLATVGLFALLGTGYLAFAGKEFYPALASAVGCSDIGLCAALLAMPFTRRGRPACREAFGVAVFNGMLGMVGLTLILIARAGVIQESIRQDGTSLRTTVQDFLTAPPALPPQS